ncbi:hypothetical protein EJ02DRAFT_423288 [Clathrospora elynae]|uniref:Uncharacterized protein n=1 Tax=Clathrospora elynae TaxID=706981 RepID=A0A6A5SNF1_9PLEO|nr:hypothetical protein EJ02DRAFT_423288 [Clathrospora elynae]
MASTVSFGNDNNDFQAGAVYGPVHTTFHLLPGKSRDGAKSEHAPMVYLVPERPETPPQPSIVIPFARDADFIERGTILKGIYRTKSQLAIEHACRTRERSLETWVFWLYASNAAQFEQSFRDIADCVKIARRQDPQANIFKMVHDWLQDCKQQWLLVLDNVDDARYSVIS